MNGQLYLALVVVVLISACSTENSQNAEEPAQTPAAETTAKSTEHDGDEASIRMLFLGDSITAGYGLGEEQAFPAHVQKKATNAGFNTVTVNAGVSGDTSTGGLNRINWLLKNRVDILILELGGNDGLRGVDLALTESNLASIIEKTKSTWPEAQIVVAGMMVPPNLGHEYTEAFRNIFPNVAAKYDATLIPFVLEGVGGIPELNQADGIHPTAKGHEIVAQTVWETIEPLLEDR